MTAPELEQEFDLGASLFLARITSWLRLSYLSDKASSSLQLNSISIFIGAANGSRFLIEFMEAGGPLTVLEIVRLREGRESDKTEALKLLLQVVNSGRQYKEFLCENGAIRGVAECLGNSPNLATQEASRQVLHKLAIGNPRYSLKVYSSLVALLQARSPSAQKLAASTLRKLNPTVKPSEAVLSVVEPACILLRSTDSETQLEGQLLLRDVASNAETRKVLIISLISLLTPDDTKGKLLPLPISLQQAASAKLLKQLIGSHPDTTDVLARSNGVEGLLVAMSNIHYSDCQKQASICLNMLIESNSDGTLANQVRSVMGNDFYNEFRRDPEHLYTKMTSMQAELLRTIPQ